MFRPVIFKYDDPDCDFQSNEVQSMNTDRRNELRFWNEEHN